MPMAVSIFIFTFLVCFVFWRAHLVVLKGYFWLYVQEFFSHVQDKHPFNCAVSSVPTLMVSMYTITTRHHHQTAQLSTTIFM